MKLTAGLGSIDDYEAFARAGADEVFIGYVPERWTREYGVRSPLNRREVRYYNVQIGSRSELEILRDMKAAFGVPVSIAMNSLFYRPEQYPVVESIMAECLELGFDTFIVADPALLVFLQAGALRGRVKIHVSGEYGEMNSYAAAELLRLGASWIIYHRHVSLSEMKRIKNAVPGVETEAFFMNEKCHFTGGFCNSLHCDEFAHMCLVPYVLSGPGGAGGCDAEEDNDGESGSVPGASGCGLCALWQLREAGVDALKIVGRGLSADELCVDLRAAKEALQILESSPTEERYLAAVRERMFPHGCGRNCYYR